MALYNFAAAFVEYSKGAALDDIALALAIPITKLKARAHQEQWHMLAPTIPPAPVVDNSERQRDRIKANREKNLAIAQKLQEDAIRLAEDLVAGRLKVTKVTSKGEKVVTDPTLRDRADFAAYLKSVAEISYRALGDVEQSKNAPADPALATAQQITIFLPPAVSAARQERAVDVDAQVVTPMKPAAIAETT